MFLLRGFGLGILNTNDVSVMFLVGGLGTCDEDLMCCCDVERFCWLFLVFWGLGSWDVKNIKLG